MSGSISGVGAVILFVEDLARSKAFYEGPLGLAVQFEDADSVGYALEGAAFILLRVDRAREQLGGEPTTTPARGATAFLTAFTDRVDDLAADLSGRGVAFFQAPTDQPWGMRTAYFKDPDGHVWELAQALERA